MFIDGTGLSGERTRARRCARGTRGIPGDQAGGIQHLRAAKTRARRSPRRRPGRSTKRWPKAAVWRGWLKRFRRAPVSVQMICTIVATLSCWFLLNGIYHVVRKPSELFFPVSGALYKTPTQTWRDYAPIFRAHSTAVMTPGLLAALAQVEASGNPLVRTYWRWSLTPDPLDIYRPASSAVGMFQIIDGTFAEARRYCIHDHVVVEDGPWHDFDSCWFNSLYMRVLPSHAVELTSAYLDRRVADTLARQRAAGASLLRRQELATLIHLCGAGAGNAFVRRGFVLSAHQRCGDHDVRAYLNKVARMQAEFARLAVRTPA